VSQSAPCIYVTSLAMFIGDQLISANPGLSGWNQFQIRAGDAKETLETQLTKTDGRISKSSAALLVFLFGVLCTGYFRWRLWCWRCSGAWRDDGGKAKRYRWALPLTTAADYLSVSCCVAVSFDRRVFFSFLVHDVADNSIILCICTNEGCASYNS